MNIDATRFRAALKAVHPSALSPGDAETIMAIAQMSVDADGQENTDEIQMFFALGKTVYFMAGLNETPSPAFPDDDPYETDQRIAGLAAKLSTPESRDLAYAVAHLLTVIDIQIAREEEAFLEKLRTALAISDDHAEELALKLGQAIDSRRVAAAQRASVGNHDANDFSSTGSIQTALVRRPVRSKENDDAIFFDRSRLMTTVKRASSPIPRSSWRWQRSPRSLSATARSSRRTASSRARPARASGS